MVSFGENSSYLKTFVVTTRWLQGTVGAQLWTAPCLELPLLREAVADAGEGPLRGGGQLSEEGPGQSALTSVQVRGGQPEKGTEGPARDMVLRVVFPCLTPSFTQVLLVWGQAGYPGILPGYPLQNTPVLVPCHTEWALSTERQVLSTAESSYLFHLC